MFVANEKIKKELSDEARLTTNVIKDLKEEFSSLELNLEEKHITTISNMLITLGVLVTVELIVYSNIKNFFVTSSIIISLLTIYIGYKYLLVRLTNNWRTLRKSREANLNPILAKRSNLAKLITDKLSYEEWLMKKTEFNQSIIETAIEITDSSKDETEDFTDELILYLMFASILAFLLGISPIMN